MSNYGAFIEGFFVCDYHTETAGTVIDEQIPGMNGKRLTVIDFEYLAAATAHIASFLFPGASAGCRTYTTALAASGQKVINVNDTPLDPAGNAAAASDIVAYQCTDGSWEFNTIASVATKAITHGTNLAKNVAAGGLYRIFGVVGDGCCQKLYCTASVVTSKHGYFSVIHPYTGDPMYLTITNATNAGFLYGANCAYINK